MAMNFAPYQADDPESTRALSPPLRSPTTSPKPHQPRPHQNLSAVTNEDPWAAARAQRLPSPSQYADEEDDELNSGGYTDLERGNDPRHNDYLDNRGDVYTYTGNTSLFETSLGLPLRTEACLAYLLLPPAGGVILLLFEQKSDYVRFHAWQSSLVFGALFLLHIVFSWTSIISWMLFAFDMLLIVYLTLGAWRHAETLDRVEIPWFGRLASSFVDDE